MKSKKMHIDLLGGEPLHAIRDAPRALMAQQRRKRHTQTGVGLSATCEAIVVVRLREVNERAELLRAHVRRRKVLLELAAIILSQPATSAWEPGR